MLKHVHTAKSTAPPSARWRAYNKKLRLIARDPRNTPFDEDEDATLEEDLALTFVEAITKAPSGHPFTPSLLWRRYYHGDQEDAHEFLHRLFDCDLCPALNRLFRGINHPTLSCQNPLCVERLGVRGSMNTKSVEAAEEFTSLDIEIDTFDSLQAAIGAFLEDAETVSLQSWACPACGDTSAPAKRNRLLAGPALLCVQLQRFRTQFQPGFDAEATQTYLQHRVNCEESLAIAGTQYKQCARIYHKGASLRTGYYYAICRHERPDGPWWYYNDEERRAARPEDDDAADARVYLALYAKDA